MYLADCIFPDIEGQLAAYKSFCELWDSGEMAKADNFPGSAPYLGSLLWLWQKAREFIRMQKDSRLSRMQLDGWIAMKSLTLKTSALLEIFLIQALLYLVLLPLKLIYRAPQPSWNSWFMNQKLCQLDRQYC